ncbi:MAG: hypothetical protein GF308_10095 [Candidatus Heimdallarchaeota archaeon]|nr:hypothetical protein [Candidatus Heimdallarchaeota archaeon]
MDVVTRIELFIAIVIVLTFIFFLLCLILFVKKYFEKKSMGTFYLTLMYFFGLLASGSAIVTSWSVVFNSDLNFLTPIFNFGIVIIYGAFLLGIICMYFFADRIVFNDPQPVKFLHALVTGMVLGMMLERAIHNDVLVFSNDIANYQVQTPIVNLYITILFVIVWFYVVLRIAITFFINASKISKPERRLTILTIGWVQIIYMLSSISAGIYPRITNNVYLFSLFLILVWLLIMLGGALSYLGWVLPQWYKRLFLPKIENEDAQ